MTLHVRGVFAPHSLAPGEQATQTASKQAGVASPQGSAAKTHIPLMHVRGVCPSHPFVPSMHPVSPASLPPEPPCPAEPPSPASSFVPASPALPPVDPVTRIALLSPSQAAMMPIGTRPNAATIHKSPRNRPMLSLLDRKVRSALSRKEKEKWLSRQVLKLRVNAR